MANYSFPSNKSLPNAEGGQVFEMYNFTQAKPHTKVFEGVTGLVFKNCNLLNCDLPDDAKVEDCLHIHKEFCANLHPEWSAYLDAEPEDCSHVVDKDEVTVDGQVVDTIYYYEDKIVL